MSRYFRVLAPFIIAAILLHSGCVNQRQDTSACNGTIHVSFYTQSRCETAPAYPGVVTDFLVAVFNGDGVLEAYSRHQTANLSESFSERFELPEGLYTAVAWSGLDPGFFSLRPLLTGITTRADLLLGILRDGETAVPLEGAVVTMGESPAFYISPGVENEERTWVNMLGVTNRIEVFVEGLPDGGEGYTVTIEADNGSMDIDGSIAPDEVLVYTPSEPANPEDGVLSASFTLLRLDTGHIYRLVITRDSDGDEIFRHSLLGALILENPEIDLLCDHDFTLRITAEDTCACGTYAITRVWVNNWLVHSYSTDL